MSFPPWRREKKEESWRENQTEERTGERREKEVQLTVIIRNLNEQLRVCEGYETAPTGDWTQDLQFTRLTLYHWAIEALMQKGTLKEGRHTQFQPLFLPCQCMQGFLEGRGSKGKQRRSKGREKSNERRRKETSERERERETEIQQHFQILGKSKAMKEQSPIDCIWCHELTAVGFEPTQLALVELESTPLDHSGKLSCNTWWQWLGYRVRGVSICLTFCMNVWCLTTMSFAQVKEKQKWDNRTQDREMDKRQTQ